jgi:hypothetical protein
VAYLQDYLPAGLPALQPKPLRSKPTGALGQAQTWDRSLAAAVNDGVVAALGLALVGLQAVLTFAVLAPILGD